MRVILGQENSHMTFISEIDTILINYSYESDILDCHFSVKHGQTKLILNTIIDFWYGNSNITSTLNIDKKSLIIHEKKYVYLHHQSTGPNSTP